MSGLVLSIDQPYASGVILGVKPWETRPAPFNGDMRPKGVRGLPGCTVNAGDRILIHASARVPADRTTFDHGHVDPLIEQLPTMWTRLDQCELGGGTYRWCGPVGALLGSVRVEDCIPIDEYDTCERDAADRHICIGYREPLELVDHEHGDEDISEQLPWGIWKSGRWAIELADPRPFDTPIAVTGRQGVWRWDGTVRP